MEQHYTIDDIEFEIQFENLTMNPEFFTHEAHLRLAWIHIRKYGVRKAIEHACKQIQAFASFHGGGKKYHVTVTVAAVRAVYHFILKSKSETFQDFIQEFPRLKYSFKQLIGAHYGNDIFKSEMARKAYLEPDLIPFDQI